MGKLIDSFTDPWKICGKTEGSSYEVEHVESKKPGKRHAAHLSPYPDELLPFLPMDGPDNVYGQMNTQIKKKPYMNADVKGFDPPQPHQTASLSSIPADDKDIIFPSLSELNAEMFESN